MASNQTAAKILCASTDPLTGTTIETWQLRFPRLILAEWNTHRALSKNASSSRAIPTISLLARDSDIFIPQFKYNKAGMQPADYLSEQDQIDAEAIWQDMADYVTKGCQKLANKNGLNVAKQWSNRPLEWFGYVDCCGSGTDWNNFYALRKHSAAQDEIRILAEIMDEARAAFTPTVLKPYEWHLPYITPEDRLLAHAASFELADDLYAIFGGTGLWDISRDKQLLLVASAARACRVSYSKLDGTPSTFEDDMRRFKQLVPANDPVHASPLEHQAMPLGHFDPKYQGNLRNFAQFRQFIPNHFVPG